jgi:hypothetical protein
MKTIALFTATAALALGLTACGSDDPDDGHNAADSVPDCSDVWVVGEEIDLSTYEGCTDGDKIVAAVTRGCHDENSEYVGQVATFEDRLWVLQEGTDPTTGEGGTPGEVTEVAPACVGDTVEQAEEPTAPESTGTPEQTTAPERIRVECPEGLEDGTYIRQPNGRYIFDKDTETFYFTLSEVQAMNESYGCTVID